MNSVSKIQKLPIYLASAVTIVVMPSLMDPINVPKMVLLALGAGITLGIFWKDFGDLWKQTTRPLFVISCWLFFALVLASIFSPQPLFKSVVGVWGRNNGSLTYISLLVLFLAVASQKSSTPGIHAIKALSFLGIGCSAYGVLQTFGLDPISWENLGNEVILTLGNSNFAGAFMALTAISTLGYITKFAKSNLAKGFFLFSYLTQMYLILKSEALQGLIISLLGSGLFLGFLLSFSTVNFAKKLGIAWWVSFAATSFLALISVFGIGPLASLISPYLGSLRDRYYHWVAAVNMIKDNLIFGVGIDSFGDFYRLNRVQAAIDMRGTAASGTNNAHNTFLQIGATGGLLMLSAYLALTIYIAYRAVSALKIHEDKVLVSALISIWLAFQVQSFVSIDQIGLVVWGWILGGCIVSISFCDPTVSRGQKISEKKQFAEISSTVRFTKTNLVVMIFGLLPSILLSPVLVNELVLRNSIVGLVSSTSGNEAILRGKTVVEIAQKSKQPELRLQAANYLLKFNQNDAALALVLLNNKEFPMSFESWAATAKIYESLGEKEKAIYSRQRSVDLDPLNLEIKKLLEVDQAEN
jgi:O-antigen ligase